MRYNYTKALGLVTDWAVKEGYDDITFDISTQASFIDWEKDTLNIPKQIKIEGKWSPEIKTYLLLHELGHHQLRKDWTKFKKTLPLSAHAEHIHFLKDVGKYKRRVTYTVSCMEEEFKAWDEGFKLAAKLGVKINVKKWNELKATCLISYIRYYGARK